MRVPSDPILSCAEAGAFEKTFFAGDEAREWPAMQQAGRAVASAVLRDFQEIGGFPEAGRLLVLVGKGHNGGDALIAAGAILAEFPRATADVVFAFGERPLRPLAGRAWREFQHSAGARVSVVSRRSGEAKGVRETKSYALSLDGVFGFQFRPPLDTRTAELLRWANALVVGVRAAVDLPSGLDAPDAFHADFTYATGIVKSPVLDCANAGRLRYLELDFFGSSTGILPVGLKSADHGQDARVTVLTSGVLAPLAALRSPRSDKRTYGHVFVVAGSRNYPGAALMSVLAALHSGAGLVTAFVPESLVTAFAARAPEAMWVGWPETPGGGLALEGHHLLKERFSRATSLVIGPGLGREAETLALAREIVAGSPVPLVIDADALQPEVVRAGKAPRVLTPHAGEFARIAGDVGRVPSPAKLTPDLRGEGTPPTFRVGGELRAFAKAAGATVILKGPITRICAGEEIYHSFAGGPVLARGGSGDVLAGLTGGLLAQTPAEPMLAACRGVLWHGLAADALARAHGQTAVMTTQLLDFLGPVLRSL